MKHGKLSIGITILSALLMDGCRFLGDDGDSEEVSDPGIPAQELNNFPKRSPDGETILFYDHGYVVFDEETNQYLTDFDLIGIWAVDTEGSNKRMLIPDAHFADWSPDGEWIAFHQGAQVYKKHVKTDSLVQLSNQGRNFNTAWSPDGEWIAYDRTIEDEHGPAGVWFMEPNGGGKEYLFRARSPNWNPDGQSLIAWNGTSIWKRFEIYFLNSSTPIRKLDAVVGDNRYLRYSPDGLKIVFASQSEGGGYHQVWVMDSNDANTRQLTENGGWAADWSPDGQWIVYTETYETGRLWLVRPDGSEKQQFTFE